MSVETQEYINGLREGPLTREIPECMRNKYTVVQTVIDVIWFLILAAGHIIRGIYSSMLGRPKKDLKGGIAVVTGGGGGLGSLISLRLARLGCKIVLWDINKQGLEDTEKLVKGIGGECYSYVVNLADKDDIYRVAKKVHQEVGRVTLLINNAGVVSGQYLLDTPDYLIQRTFDVNVLAHIWTVKAFLPEMIEAHNGHIVTIASMAGHVGVAKLVDYCASKSAACGFDEALRLELEVRGAKGVTTSLICPYFIRSTGMFDQVNSRFVPQLNANEVADRVVVAIRTDEALVVMPGYFNLLMPFKWYVNYFWFEPQLNANEVADRVVVAIRTDEALVVMPGYFSLLMPFKWLVPWALLSEFLRRLVPDAAPAGAPPPAPAPAHKPAPAPATLTKLDARPLSLAPPARHDRRV